MAARVSMMSVVGWMMVVIMLGCSLKAIEATTDETEKFHVGGIVKCQNCSGDWNEWAEGGRPIEGARVSITCLDEGKGLAFYNSDATDKYGKFNMVVVKVIHGKNLNPKDCIVRLVSCPDKSCNIPTDFGQGNTGVKLRQPSVMFRDKTEYDVGSFFYTTPTCDVNPDDDTKSYQGSK
ncbi:non-classical arabinogalactan protein 30-like [Chenopodium quinoa]|uniref:Pistil-specific extensin-like protein n=1 Tax=Chenopodium quinoa TaxID=63459 RepID=A0A803M3I4_CHEQI|nr:non-classical arabinogalactan protein 30-like [Chenopodium quinoa]